MLRRLGHLTIVTRTVNRVIVICLILICADLQAQSKVSGNDALMLKRKLESIYDDDQKYRQSSDWKMMLKMDSINQIAVIGILEEYGWVHQDIVGKKGSGALFLVIQHADLPIQEKYLPVLRDAVKSGAARKDDLALLEDRVLMRQGKKQVYGSQVVKGPNGNWVVHPIEDPEHVDERRLEIGLLPIADYLSRMGVTWNLEEHLQQQSKKRD